MAFVVLIGSQLNRWRPNTLRADSDPSHSVRKSIKQPKPTHQAPLSSSQLGIVLRAFDSRGTFTTKIAFRLMWLTLARPTEVLEAG